MILDKKFDGTLDQENNCRRSSIPEFEGQFAVYSLGITAVAGAPRRCALQDTFWRSDQHFSASVQSARSHINDFKVVALRSPVSMWEVSEASQQEVAGPAVRLVRGV